MITYQSSDEQILNPERGPFITIDPLAPENYWWVRELQGTTLARANIVLSDYRQAIDAQIDALADAIDSDP